MKRLAAFIFSMPLIPIVCIIFTGFIFYRAVIQLFLWCKHGQQFMGLLHGADAMWCMSAKDCGVVNILAFVEQPRSTCNENRAEEILQTLRRSFDSVKRDKNSPFQKGFWKRNHAFGYAFWTNDLALDSSDLIRIIDVGENVDAVRLREIVSDLSTTELPANHNAAWEILIGNQPVRDKLRGPARYFILFRFHHSLGDGISVLNFIFKEIGKNGDCSEYMPSLVNLKQRSYREWVVLVIKAVYNIPIYLLQVMFHEQPKNDWQVNELQSSKITCWHNEQSILESKRWHQLLENIHIKLPRIQYSNVFLAALSGTLHNYFHSKGQHPKFLTIALPIRMKHIDLSNMKFENAFVTPMQKLYLLPGVELNDPNRVENLKRKLSQLKQSTVKLRASSDILITHWMMSILPAILPGKLLKILGKQFSIIASVSVMPPLSKDIRIGAYELRDMTFWPPAFGTVGVNFSVLSYAGELQLALLADRTVLRSPSEGQELLAELFREIERMDIVLRDCTQ